MRLKTLLTVGLVLVFFLGEITMSFSFKSENDRNNAAPGIIPLSYKISNQSTNFPEAHIVDSLVDEFMHRYDIEGASVAITKYDRLVYAKGFGYSDLTDSLHVTPRSLFRIASVSKLITAVAIMKLVENEKLGLDDKVFGPDGILNDSIYQNYTDNRYEQITVRELLEHTAGWNGKKSDPVFNSLYVAQVMDVPPPASMPVIIEYALSHKLDFTPGKRYSYSNLGYCVLGQIIEKVTGMKYEDYIQFSILHPLGIYDMHIGKSFEDQSYPYEVHYYDMSKSYKMWAFDGSDELVPAEYGGNNMQLLGAAGGWIASAPELAKLLVAIDGYNSRADILSHRTIETMVRPKGRNEHQIGWRGADGRGTWWRTGTLSGTSALVMRQGNETTWIMLLNTTPRRRKRIHNIMARTMFQAIHSVDDWPSYDLFVTEPENKTFGDLAAN